MKYAHIERERRFLYLGGTDGMSPIRKLLLSDHYINDSTLRLRRVEEGGKPILFKLGQKIRIDGEGPLVIAHTSMYLTEREFNALRGLPSNVLAKSRSIFNLGQLLFSVDVFGGELTGLTLVEIDLGADISTRDPLPFEKTIEVTLDERFTGGKLADTSSEDLLLILTEYGAK